MFILWYSLPLGPFGSIPIIATLVIAGMKVYYLLPLFISGVLFNTSILFTEANFQFGRSTNCIIIAFIIGISAGILCKIINPNEDGLLKRNILEELAIKSKGLIKNIQNIGINIGNIGVYLIIGSIVNSIFHKYIFYDFITFVYSNNNAFSIMKIFLTHNASVKPLFLLAITIVNMLLDFLIASSLLLLFKFKGILSYFIYFSIWILILVSTVFL